MVKYLQIQPHRGAGIGHQTDEYFRILKFCRDNSIEFVYCPFKGNSEHWNKTFDFGQFHSHKKDSKHLSKFKRIDITKISHPMKFVLENRETAVYTGDLEKNPRIIHDLPKTNLIPLYDEYRNKLRFPNLFKTKNNVVVHIRRGNVNKLHYPNRFLDVQYYNKVLETVLVVSPNMNVHILSQSNIEDLSIFDKFNASYLTCQNMLYSSRWMA